MVDIIFTDAHSNHLFPLPLYNKLGGPVEKVFLGVGEEKYVNYGNLESKVRVMSGSPCVEGNEPSVRFPLSFKRESRGTFIQDFFFLYLKRDFKRYKQIRKKLATYCS